LTKQQEVESLYHVSTISVSILFQFTNISETK